MRALLLCSLLFLSACEWAKPSLAGKTVLDVNGHKMSAQEFAQELAYRLKDQDALSAKEPRLVNATKAKIADDFIVQTLTEDWAKEQNVLVKAEDLEKQIKAVQGSYPDDLSFQQALAEDGISFKVWKDRLQTTLLQKQVAQKLAAGVAAPTDAEMQTYFNAHRPEFSMRETAQVRQILVATESDAKNMEEQLKKGKKMAELAKKYSISPEAEQGGMVGWLEKGMTDTFEPAFRMKIGQRSPVVRSSFGYHIFEVVARKPAHNKPYADVKDDIKRILMEKREQSSYLAWLEEQVRKSRVFKDQEFIDALKVETKIQ
jgi:parvulin-like peptidyl-prolyl isomerase